VKGDFINILLIFTANEMSGTVVNYYTANDGITVTVSSASITFIRLHYGIMALPNLPKPFREDAVVSFGYRLHGERVGL